MSEKLSNLISKSKQPETYLNRKEVYSSIKGKIRSESADSKSFRPKRILKRQNHFIMLTSTSIVIIIGLSLLFTLPQEATKSIEPIQKPQKINSQPDFNDSMKLMVKIERNSNTIIKDSQNSLTLEKDVFHVATLKQDSSSTANLKTAFDQSTYHVEPEDLGINILELDSTTLSCLGIQKWGEGGYRIGYVDAMGYLSSINLMNYQIRGANIVWTQDHYGQITDEKLDHWGFRPLKLMDISTDLESKPNSQNISSFYGSKLDQGLIERLLNICVPVRVKLDSIPDLRIKEHEAILWIVADNELFSCLPDSIGTPMKREFEANILPWMKEIDNLMDSVQLSYPIRDIQRKAETTETKQTEPSQPIPCFYFQDLCEGLPGLDYVTVYPNPTSDFIKVDVILNREKKIAYRIFDISGRVLFDDLTKRYDGAGRYTETIDISYFTKGIYILMLSDGEGANLTKRILKN